MIYGIRAGSHKVIRREKASDPWEDVGPTIEQLLALWETPEKPRPRTDAERAKAYRARKKEK